MTANPDKVDMVLVVRVFVSHIAIKPYIAAL
jgi:hypothetical protein